MVTGRFQSVIGSIRFDSPITERYVLSGEFGFPASAHATRQDLVGVGISKASAVYHHVQKKYFYRFPCCDSDDVRGVHIVLAWICWSRSHRQSSCCKRLHGLASTERRRVCRRTRKLFQLLPPIASVLSPAGRRSGSFTSESSQ